MTDPLAQTQPMASKTIAGENGLSDPAGGMSPERIRRILAERAEALAAAQEKEAEDTVQLITFWLAGERFGVNCTFVHDVQPLGNSSYVPCAPPFVVGVVNIRGIIYSVVDIREFLGLDSSPRPSDSKVLIVSAAGLEVGLLVDDIDAAENIEPGQIRYSLLGVDGRQGGYVQGVTPEMLIVLDLEALLSDERIIVNAGVS